MVAAGELTPGAPRQHCDVRPRANCRGDLSWASAMDPLTEDASGWLSSKHLQRSTTIDSWGRGQPSRLPSLGPAQRGDSPALVWLTDFGLRPARTLEETDRVVRAIRSSLSPVFVAEAGPIQTGRPRRDFLLRTAGERPRGGRQLSWSAGRRAGPQPATGLAGRPRNQPTAGDPSNSREGPSGPRSERRLTPLASRRGLAPSSRRRRAGRSRTSAAMAAVSGGTGECRNRPQD